LLRTICGADLLPSSYAAHFLDLRRALFGVTGRTAHIVIDVLEGNYGNDATNMRCVVNKGGVGKVSNRINCGCAGRVKAHAIGSSDVSRDGKRGKASFSINFYGKADAFRRALNARRAGLRAAGI
jgi:hypothetical protein